MRGTAISGRGLVGRDDEIGELRDALSGTLRVLHLHGPGGVGKTALVRAAASLCAASRVALVRIDARDIESTSRGFLRALARAAGKSEKELTAMLRGRRRRLVILVDSYEHIAPLDRWIRTEFVPTLASAVLLVLAGRTPPSPDWRGEPEWNATWRARALTNLGTEHARQLLRTRGVSVRHDDAALAFTHGHPLAICLVADLLARRPDASLRPDAAPDLIQALLSRFVQDLADEAQQGALDAISLVRCATEPVLAVMLGIPAAQARTLLRWLAGLSFIEVGPAGVFPHDLARDVLVADLKWRSPERTAELVERASVYYASSLRGRGGDGFGVASDLLFLHSHHPLIGSFTKWDGAENLATDVARATEVPTLVAMVLRAQGRVGESVARRALARDVNEAMVVRDPQSTPAGFALMLRLDLARPVDLAGDPAAQQAMRHVAERGGHRRGHALLLQRFMIAREGHRAEPAIRSMLGAQSMRLYLTTPRLDWAFTCMPDPEPWAPVLKAAFGADLLPPFEVDGRTYGLFVHCFVDQTPAAWLASLARRGRAPGDASLVVARPLDRTELRAALMSALRGFNRKSALDENPLLASPLMASAGESRLDPASALRNLLSRTAQSLRSEPRGEKLYAAIQHTYFEPAESQQVAAKRAGLPFGSYRRHLGEGIELLIEMLWHAQRTG